MHSLFTLLLLFLSVLSYGQPDQVITLKGDTLTGKVSISTGNNTYQTITIKKGKEKNHFKVFEVKSVWLKEEEFRTIKVNNEYQLGLLMKEGYLSWYKYRDTAETSSSEFSVSVLIKMDGTYLNVPNLGFKKNTQKFLDDCPAVRAGFSEKTYKKSDIALIVEDYNNCIAQTTIKLNKEAAEASLTSEKAKQIAALINNIKVDGTLPELDNVLDMLNDLKLKSEKGTKIPNYLETALRASLKSNNEFTTQLNKILE